MLHFDASAFHDIGITVGVAGVTVFRIFKDSKDSQNSDCEFVTQNDMTYRYLVVHNIKVKRFRNNLLLNP